MGGEKSQESLQGQTALGSPPRGRGKVDGGFLGGCGLGITPAWAGKSQTESFGITSKRDHPRVGGEKSVRSSLINRCLGSPPRGRGKAEAFQTLLIGMRITPAWAGKSSALHTLPCRPRDHPRVGGEKLSCLVRGCRRKGSPPRGRGKVILHPMHCPHGRITPAWAGKRLMHANGFVCPKDHPRVGGEKTKKIP